MKILNLYAGIGGNRKYWTNVDVVAVEYDERVAQIYKDHYPDDIVIVSDAHAYMLEHFNKFDFIWSSPPCPTHSITRFMQNKKVYPDMRLYQEIIFLKQWFKGSWVIENVIPYYDYLIKPKLVLHRHAIWSNFFISHKEFPKMQTCKKKKEREFLQDELGFNLDQYDHPNKRLLLRNCVLPDMGLHILNAAQKKHETLNVEQQVLFGV